MFKKRKALRKELIKALRENDYLKNERKKAKDTLEGYRQLMKIYEAVILYLGEKIKAEDKGGDFRERTKALIELLEGGGL